MGQTKPLGLNARISELGLLGKEIGLVPRTGIKKSGIRKDKIIKRI